MRAVFRGFAYPFRGLFFVLRHPDLVRFWFPPILITAIAFVLAVFGAVEGAGGLTDWVWASPVGDAWWMGLLRVLHSVLQFLVGFFLAALGIVLVVVLAAVVAAPFNDALSEAVERKVRGGGAGSFLWKQMVGDVARTVGIECIKLSAYAAVMVPLWLLSMFVPVVGPILYAVFGAVFSWMYFAIDYVDWPASRRKLTVATRLNNVRAHFPLMLGFGAAVAMLLFIPLLNLCLMPGAVAGGTLLFLEHMES